MISLIERWPWTKTIVAVFIGMAILTAVRIQFGWEVPDGWYEFVLIGLGGGIGGTVGKRIATRASVVREVNSYERVGKAQVL